MDWLNISYKHVGTERHLCYVLCPIKEVWRTLLD